MRPPGHLTLEVHQNLVIHVPEQQTEGADPHECHVGDGKAVETWTHKMGLFLALAFVNVLGQCVHKNVQRIHARKIEETLRQIEYFLKKKIFSRTP